MTIWFGFRTLNLTPAVILQVGAKSSVLLGACAFVVAPVAASFLVPWKDLACNAGFILVSVASAVVPTVLMAMVSAELPVIIGMSQGSDSKGSLWQWLHCCTSGRPECMRMLDTLAEYATQWLTMVVNQQPSVLPKLPMSHQLCQAA